MSKIQLNRFLNLDTVLLLLFLIIYEFSSTIYSLPYNDILRWIVCFVLVFLYFLHSILVNDGHLSFLTKEFLFLLFPLFIQSFWNFEQLNVALSRSFSFILYCLAIDSFFHRNNQSSENISYMFYSLFAFSILVVLPLNIIAFNNESLAGDYIGVYVNRNMTTSVLLSVFVMLGFVLLLGDFKTIIFKPIIIIFMGITAVLIFRTHSRMSIVGVFIAIFMIWYFSSSKITGLKFVFIAGIAVIVFLALPYIGDKYGIISIERIFSDSVSNGSTGFSRNNIWDEFWVLVQEKPLLGWGNNSVYYNTFVHPKGSGWGVHNSYYVMLIEGGIVGTIFYLLFFVFYIKNSITLYRKCKDLGLDHNKLMLARYCLVICVVLAVNAFAESFLFSAGNIMSLPFWFSFIGGREMLRKYYIENSY